MASPAYLGDLDAATPLQAHLLSKMAAYISEVDGGEPSAEDQARALELKTEGNTAIGQCKYSIAAQKYTEAIRICPSAVLYSNRAQAYIKMESYGIAIEDADQAIK